MSIQNDIYRTQARTLASAFCGNITVYTNDDGKFEIYKDALGDTARPVTAQDVIAHADAKVMLSNWAGVVTRADLILPSPDGVTLIVDTLNTSVIMVFNGETVVHKYSDDVLGLRDELVNAA